METSTLPVLDHSATVEIIGGTLICAGALLLVQSPRVRAILIRIVPELRQLGRRAVGSVGKEIAASFG
jgi:hypothetical protein